MFDFVPPWKLPTVTTAVSVGATSRETMVCSRPTMAAPSTIGSTPRFGMEPWVPAPWTVISMELAVVSTGPRRVPTAPPGTVPSTCCASATSGFGSLSTMPASTMSRAPAPASSPGWKMARNVPDQASRCLFSCSTAPSRAVTWTSWPQEWATPGLTEA